MKRVLVLLGIMLFGGIVQAGEPVWLQMKDSRYDYTNGTLSVSSFSAASFPAVNNYRHITMASSTSFFYTLDGTSSSTTIVSTGYPALANLNIDIDSNQEVYITLPVGVAATSLRYITKQK